MKNAIFYLKEPRELPDSFKFLKNHLPESGVPLRIRDTREEGWEIYFTVLMKNKETCVLNSRHFRTLEEFKLLNKQKSENDHYTTNHR